jgi:hypothetical protein
MSINYTYTIKSVDESARCMEVVYEAAGYTTMTIGTRLPFSGEALEDVVDASAPIPHWEDSVKTVVAPAVGLVGIKTAPVVPTQAPDDAALVLTVTSVNA